MGDFLAEWVGNAAVALIAVGSLSATLHFTVWWVTAPQPDRPVEPPSDWFDRMADTVPLPGGGR